MTYENIIRVFISKIIIAICGFLFALDIITTSYFIRRHSNSTRCYERIENQMNYLI